MAPTSSSAALAAAPCCWSPRRQDACLATRPSQPFAQLGDVERWLTVVTFLAVSVADGKTPPARVAPGFTQDGGGPFPLAGEVANRSPVVRSQGVRGWVTARHPRPLASTAPGPCMPGAVLNRDRTRCPRRPACRCTTRCSHRQAALAHVPHRARSVGRIRPGARPGAPPPRARCRRARRDAPGS